MSSNYWWSSEGIPGITESSGVMAANRALVKNGVYNEACKGEGMKFVPISLESYGFMDPEAVQWIHTISKDSYLQYDRRDAI